MSGLVERARESLDIADNPNCVPTLPFPKCGVKISVFHEFVKESNDNNYEEFSVPNDYFDPARGKSLKSFNELTTTDVSEIILKPIVVATESSYCEYLQANGMGDQVGTAHVFISHAWKYLFADIVSALSNHFKDEPDTFIWFDLFSNNQIVAPDLDFNWWSNTFRGAIEEFGHVVVVCSPWNKPIPFTRAWCLYELYCAAVTNSKVEVAMSQEEEKIFFKEVLGNSSAYFSMLGNINVANSECWKPEDKDNIFAVVNQLENKANTINALVCGKMRDWFTNMLSDDTSPMSKSLSKDERMQKVMSLADMQSDSGMYQEGIRGYEDVLQYRRNKLEGDSDNLDIAATLNNLGTALKNSGDFEKALECYQQALDIRVRLLGEQDANVGSSYCNLANVYNNLGQYDAALQYYEKDMQITIPVLGSDDTNCATTYHNMASVYSNLGEYDRAMELCRKALCIRTEKLNHDHPYIAFTYTAMAAILERQGEYAKAEEYARHSLEIRKVKLSATHPNIADTYYVLGNIYRSQSNLEEARKCYEEDLSILSTILDVDHADIQNSREILRVVNVAISLEMEMESVTANKSPEDKEEMLELITEMLQLLSTRSRRAENCRNKIR